MRFPFGSIRIDNVDLVIALHGHSRNFAHLNVVGDLINCQYFLVVRILAKTHVQHGGNRHDQQEVDEK